MNNYHVANHYSNSIDRDTKRINRINSENVPLFSVHKNFGHLFSIDYYNYDDLSVQLFDFENVDSHSFLIDCDFDFD